MKRFALIVAIAALVCSSGILTPNPRALNQGQARQTTPDLNGQWKDGDSTITISQTGSAVNATYNKPHPCDPQDGSPIQHTDWDFSGTLSGNQLTGETHTCGWGKGNRIHGLGKATLKLEVSADGRTLSGTWWNVEANNNKGADESITITRDCSPDKGKLCSGIARSRQTLATAEQR